MTDDGRLSRNISLYNVFNAGKRSVTLNMGHPRGADYLRQLIAVSDVMIDNFLPTKMAAWGFSYEEVRAINPRLVVVSMPFMAPGSPYQDLMGFGRSMLAMSGFNSVMGFPGDPPLGTNNDYPDFCFNAYNPALAILAALFHRDRTGEGQYIEVWQYESTVAALETTLLRYTANGERVGQEGNHVAYAAPHGVYRCDGDDRWCTIAVRTAEHWQGFCESTGHSDWLVDPRFESLASRKANESALDMLVEEWTKDQTPEDVMRTLQAAGVPSGIAQNAQDLVDRDPNLSTRERFVRLDHEEDGLRVYGGLQAHLSETPGRMTTASPLLGEANEYVFRELLSLSEDEVNQAYIDGVLS